MPTVGVNRDNLFKKLGEKFTDEEFDELCFEFGLELDEVTSEKQMISKERGESAANEASDSVIYKIDVAANRYDLLSIEGLSRSLLIFKGKQKPPVFRIDSVPKITIEVDSAVNSVRPFVVGAVLRDFQFTPEIYASFIDLQDKLHQNLCRRRALVSMGTHDLDQMSGNVVTYTAWRPSDIKFIPLNDSKMRTAEECMSIFAEGHLKPYLPILAGKDVYPVIEDSSGVLSWPPIINSDRSKISLKTRNIFIEITATDRHKAEVVLDNFVCIFSEYCTNKFYIEPVRVNYYNGGSKSKLTESVIYPLLTSTVMSVELKYFNSRLGLSLSGAEAAKLLNKMGFEVKIIGCKLDIVVPPNRSDVIHPCDIVEDIAIAFGYNNLNIVAPKTLCFGEMQPLNQLTDLMRLEMAMAGYTEALTFALCSRDDVSTKLRRKLVDTCLIANPKTLEFQVARTSLLPGLLKALHSNKSVPLPLKLFEISDVVLADEKRDTGARNRRRLSAVHYGTTPGFEQIHGLVDRLMQVLGVANYKIVPSSDPSFFPGHCGDLQVLDKRIGTLGVLHPDVITAFDLSMPTSAIEIDLEHYV